MSSRDLAVTRARLERLAGVVAALLAHLEDLHSLAFEPVGRGLDVAVRGGEATGVEAVGDARARATWTELTQEVRAADRGLGEARRKTLNLLSEGPPAPEVSRGSMIRPEDFEAAKARQARRRADGEHVPVRLFDQPDYPGGDQK